jgi:hypothetical protein
MFMTYGELEKEFENKIKNPDDIDDFRPCEEMYGVPTILGAIVIWFKDGSKMIYIPNKS